MQRIKAPQTIVFLSFDRVISLLTEVEPGARAFASSFDTSLGFESSMFWVQGCHAFADRPDQRSPVQCHRESVRLFRWRACFRGVTAKFQVLGRCPESMAPDAGHYWSWYTAPMAASLVPFERVPRAFTMI